LKNKFKGVYRVSICEPISPFLKNIPQRQKHKPMFLTSQFLFAAQRICQSVGFLPGARLRSNASRFTDSGTPLWPLQNRTKPESPDLAAIPAGYCAESPVEWELAQNCFTMKGSRKQQGELAADYRARVADSLLIEKDPNQLDPMPITNDPVFFEPPSPRQPRSRRHETLRSLIKTHLPDHKASPDLLRKIRSIAQDAED
jgi:hypothetical protein